MSIKPAYAEHIKNGRKTVELRRVLPRIEAGDMIIVYESAPIQRITMTCIVEKTLSCETDKLWCGFGQEACIDYEAFKKYFQGKRIANGIF